MLVRMYVKNSLHGFAADVLYGENLSKRYICFSAQDWRYQFPRKRVLGSYMIICAE